MWLLAKIAVTPLAGVWIEIVLHSHPEVMPPSLPLRECGLKFCVFKTYYSVLTSLPLRECGLKSESFLHNCRCHSVTPLAGVWIEIRYHQRGPAHRLRHSPCGSVDWNDCIVLYKTVSFVTPLAGVWIEISFSALSSCSALVTPLAGVWIEIVM